MSTLTLEKRIFRRLQSNFRAAENLNADLLEALKIADQRLLAGPLYSGGEDEALRIIRDAIYKAEGRP